MDRYDFQTLARVRLKEANALLAADLFDGAYYLAGYAAECALKACIARATQRYEFPDRGRVNACHTHDIAELVKPAGLEAKVRVERIKDAEFDRKWTIVQSWSERSRYKRINAVEARSMVRSIGGRGYGILSWLRRYW